MKLGIAGRLSIWLASFAVGAATLTGAYVYRVGRDLLTEAAQERLLTTTQVLGRRIVGVVDTGIKDVFYLADNENVRALLRQPQGPAAKSLANDLSDHLQAVMKVNPQYYQLRIISADENGMERVRVDRENEHRLLRVDGLDLQEKGHYDYVRDALQVPPGQFYVSRMTINHEAGAHAGSEVPTQRIAAPVRDGDKVIGIVVANLSLAGIFSVLGKDLPVDHELYLTDNRGEFLVHPDHHRAFAFDRGQSARVQDEFPATQVLFDGQQTHVQTTEARRDGQERAVAASFIRVDKVGIGADRYSVIGLAQARDEVLKSANALGLAVVPVALVLIIVAVAVATLLAQRMTRPLQRLASAVAYFPREQLDLTKDAARGDEIGTLAAGLMTMQSDIIEKMEELHAQRSDLAHLARHDPLTALPNRLLFGDRAEQALARARRSGEEVALMFIDLDKFKIINDTWGHAAGDKVLVTVAERLRATVRESDTVARLGGDEFVVLLEGSMGLGYLAMVASKLIDAIKPEIPFQDARLRVSVSIGVACFPRDGVSVDALASQADKAMYRVKRMGGSNFQFPKAD